MSERIERRSMRSWGRYLGDLDHPQTIQEAQLHAAMASTDLLMEVVRTLSDIQNRLTRIELWIDRNDPNYQQNASRASLQPALNGRKEHAPDDTEATV